MREAKELLEDALEKALKEDAAELLSQYPQLRRATPLRRKIGFKGFQLDIRVPRVRRPNGELRFPPRFEELSRDPNKAMLLRRHGVTTRNVGPVLKAIYGEDVDGTSRSTVSHDDIEAGKEAVRELENREYHDESIVAAALDGTWVGTRNRKRTVMIVVGVRADGTRMVLDVFVAQHEPSDVITPRLRRLVEKGVSPDVYWVADSGAGIKAALKAIKAKNVGTCTTHAVGNVTKGLPEEIKEQFWPKIYGALSEDERKAALARLDEVEGELRDLGYQAQADTLDRHKEGMVKTQELGLKGELRKQLRSTNALVEGQNHTVKVRLTNVSNWQDKDDTMRERWVAKRALELERDSWKRLADPQGLVELGERLGLSGFDPAPILAQLPPSLAVERVATPLAELEQLGRPGANWLADNPDARWFGAPEALAKLGATPGAAVGADELARAMRGEHTVSGETVREPSDVNVVVRGKGWASKELKVPGVLNLEWQLTASHAFMSRWRAADAGQRAELEAAFEDAATAAMERATKTTQPGHGFAATADLSRRSPEAPEAESVLRISGLIVGISRDSGAELNSPPRSGSLSALSRDAEDAAKAVLDRALGRLTALSPDLSEHPPEEPSPSVLAGVELRALEKAPRMVGQPRALAATARDEAAARADLGRACGEASGWWKAHQTSAARQMASARLRDPARAKEDLWFPLSPGRRLLLGEERALDLRVEVEELLGRADASERFANELAGFDADPLEQLGTGVERVERLTEAIAARHELARRKLFKTARERTPPREADPAPIRVLDHQGKPAKRPVERFEGALGRVATPLRRYSAALSPKVTGLRRAALDNLIRELGEPWGDLDQDAGSRHARLEQKREVVLSKLLVSSYRAGQDSEVARTAAGKGNIGEAFDASDGFHEAERERLRGELEEIRKQIDDAREAGRAPEPERFAAQHPEAAIYDAAFAEVQRRELARGAEKTQLVAEGRAPADTGPDIGM